MSTTIIDRDRAKEFLKSADNNNQGWGSIFPFGKDFPLFGPNTVTYGFDFGLCGESGKRTGLKIRHS